MLCGAPRAWKLELRSKQHEKQDPRLHHYVVSNWRGHRLAAPQRGYHWVQVGPDYVLAAIATGVIANLVLGS